MNCEAKFYENYEILEETLNTTIGPEVKKPSYKISTPIFIQQEMSVFF